MPLHHDGPGLACVSQRSEGEANRGRVPGARACTIRSSAGFASRPGATACTSGQHQQHTPRNARFGIGEAARGQTAVAVHNGTIAVGREWGTRLERRACLAEFDAPALARRPRARRSRPRRAGVTRRSLAPTTRCSDTPWSATRRAQQVRPALAAIAPVLARLARRSRQRPSARPPRQRHSDIARRRARRASCRPSRAESRCARCRPVPPRPFLEAHSPNHAALFPRSAGFRGEAGEGSWYSALALVACKREPRKHLATQLLDDCVVAIRATTRRSPPDRSQRRACGCATVSTCIRQVRTSFDAQPRAFRSIDRGRRCQPQRVHSPERRLVPIGDRLRAAVIATPWRVSHRGRGVREP